VSEPKSMNGEDRVNILMVDDQPAKLLSYEAILAELGENLIKADSGNEALELLLKNDVAVVLMDVSMPGLDGFELAQMIRQHPRFQQVAIIFISAVHLTDIDRLQGYQRGAVDYISVPVVPELLRAKVSLFVALHRKTRELEMLNQELRRLSSALIVSQDEERRRIARELHDGLGQELGAAKMLIDGLSNPNLSPQWKENAVSEGSATLSRAIQQVRSVAHLLHPPLLDEVGLCSALQQYLEGFTKRSGIETCLNLPSRELPKFKPELETAIFRMIQEALTHVLRHSEAHKAWISIDISDSQITVTVRDDGKGIPKHVAELRSGSVGIGISGMQQRVREFGGQVYLQNAHPGTLVAVTVPIASMLRASEPAAGAAPGLR
jgi:signal transduction histidine kinase